MKKEKLLNILTIILGGASVLLFVFNFIFLVNVSPKMIAFEELSTQESNLLTVVGFGLLVILCFCLLSLLKNVKYIRYAEKITFLSVLLLIGGILTMLFIFADIALLTDIANQYEAGLAQPEWSLVFPIMGAQAVIVLVLFVLHLGGFFTKKQFTTIAKDSNIYIVVQYVGIICGGIGLTATSLGFFFPSSWNLFIHTVISLVILLSPYGLAVLYWLIIKMREKDKQFYDEKQRLDIGRSAFMTILITTFVLTVLFAVNFNNLDGILSLIWLPLYVFGEVFIFSIGNLYYSNKP